MCFVLIALCACSEGGATDFEKTKMRAEAGHADAQTTLGFMYSSGMGVVKDEVESAKWFHKAANQGNAAAQYNLADICENGRGMPKDLAEAAKLYRKAADQGYQLAISYLGYMYANGKGVQQDFGEAYAWYNLASIFFEHTKKERDELAKGLSPEALARAQKRSTELFNEIEARKKAAGK